MKRSLLFLFASAASLIVNAASDPYVILTEGRVMTPDIKLEKNASSLDIELENQRRRLRDSVTDLARVLEKMTGRDTMIVTNGLGKTKGEPIYIGKEAEALFGEVGRHCVYDQAFRMVSTKNAVGLFGESDLASSYAIYTFLEKAGCRWYMAGPLGEFIPEKPDYKPGIFDETDAPYTYERCGHSYIFDAEFMRRSRSYRRWVGEMLPLERYIPKEEMEKNPHWYAVDKDGKQMRWLRNWNTRGYAERVATRIRELNKEAPREAFRIYPTDGAEFDQSKEALAADAGDFEPTFQQPAITDRLMKMGNRIAEYNKDALPDAEYRFLAYVQYCRPPLRERPAENMRVIVAPIMYTRIHPATDDRVPNNADQRYIIDGWGKFYPQEGENPAGVGWYFYGFNLGDEFSPSPLLRKWAVDLPLIYTNGACRYFVPDSMSNNEFFAMANYFSTRIAWNPKDIDPWAIYREVNDALYGRAADVMWKYWNEVDRQWCDSDEFSGSGWGNLRRFPNNWIRETDKLIQEARRLAPDGNDGQHVRLAWLNWEMWKETMYIRSDLLNGSRWNTVGTRATEWPIKQKMLEKEYGSWKCFNFHENYSIRIFNGRYRAMSVAAEKIAKTGNILLKRPHRQMKFLPIDMVSLTNMAGAGSMEPAKRRAYADVLASYLETNSVEQLMSNFASVGFDDSKWSTTDIGIETWSTLGLHNYVGRMLYRTELTLDKPVEKKDGKRVWLWIAVADRNTEVFVNGKRCLGARDDTYQPGDELTEKVDSGWTPRRFDVTDAINGEKNTIAIIADRTETIGELGIGGLMGPITVFEQ